MCIIIDTNTFASVFSTNSVDHDEFKPVADWIKCGGKIVFGGTKYKTELRQGGKYLRIFNQLKLAGKCVEVGDDAVDSLEEELQQEIKDGNFNDHHILGLAIASGCLLVCTKDKPLQNFLKNKKVFPKRSPQRKIYCKKSSKSILCDKHITKICK